MAKATGRYPCPLTFTHPIPSHPIPSHPIPSHPLAITQVVGGPAAPPSLERKWGKWLDGPLHLLTSSLGLGPRLVKGYV